MKALAEIQAAQQQRVELGCITSDRSDVTASLSAIEVKLKRGFRHPDLLAIDCQIAFK